jgi:hypothetical protein
VLPQGRLCDRLSREQTEYFAAAAARVAGA